jgi:hypothetical protein
MPKAHLYEAILLVNRGVDEAVRGLERLKRAKDSQLNLSCFDAELVLFEDHRARLNSYFCGTIRRSEQQDSTLFETRYCEYEERTLDEVQVYRDMRMLEDRRRVEGKPPKVRSSTQEEQREWERQYPSRLVMRKANRSVAEDTSHEARPVPRTSGLEPRI